MKKINIRNQKLALWVILGMVLLSPLVSYVVVFGNNGISTKNSDWASFATYVSALITILISTVSAVLIYFTYKNQLRFSEQQQADSQKQQFEATFFNLLQNQREILKSLSWQEPQTSSPFDEPVYEGSELIDHVAKWIDHYFYGYSDNRVNNDNLNAQLAFSDQETRVRVQRIFSFIHNSTKKQLDHYFKHLYHAMKYVTESGIPDVKKYIDILQSQMSDNELYVTMYKCMSDNGIANFLLITDQYGFFESVDTRGVLFDKHKNIFFTNTNFERNTELQQDFEVSAS